MKTIALAAAMVALFATAAADAAEYLVDAPEARESCERQHLANARMTNPDRAVVVLVDRPDLWAASMDFLPEGIVLISCQDGRARAELIRADMAEIKRQLGIE